MAWVEEVWEAAPIRQKSRHANGECLIL